MDIAMYKKKMDLRDLQRELTKNGELITSDNTVTRHESKLGQALIDAGIKVVPGFMLDGKQFDFKVWEFPVLIEVDGGVHNDSSKRIKDYAKDRVAQIRGYRVLRYSNDEVQSHIDNVVRQIRAMVSYCGRQPRQVFIYPLSIYEQIRFFFLTKILRKKHRVFYTKVNLKEEIN
jgi:very-short-patch-repair endonuclease